MSAERIKTDVVVGVILLLVAGAYWLGAGAISVGGLSGTLSARALPQLLAVVLAIFAVILILQGVLVRKSAALTFSNMREHGRALGMLAIGVAFALGVEFLGYVVAVFALLLVVALYLGARPSIRLFLFAAIGAGLFWALFAKLLHIALPVGFLAGIG